MSSRKAKKTASPAAEMPAPTEPEAAPITAYKAFDSNLQCRGFQYEIGKTYEHSGSIEICESGFHACEYPLDVLRYYAPAGSRFALVRQSGAVVRHEGDSKVASAKITIGAELHLPQLIERAIKWVFDRAKLEEGSSATGYSGAASATGVSGAASATGDRGAASATGYRGAASATGVSGAASATGVSGAASATGYSGAASATGYSGAASATGDSGAASATGDRGRVMGAVGCALFLVYRQPNTGEILQAWAGIAGRDGIKPLVWYTLDESGKPVELDGAS